GLGVEAVEQRPAGVYLAGRMAIVTADDLGEVMLDAEVAERVVQRVLLLRRQDRLRHAAVRQALERRARVRLQRAFDDARVVLLAVVRCKPVERLGVEVEAELPIVELDRKVEDLPVTNRL